MAARRYLSRPKGSRVQQPFLKAGLFPQQTRTDTYWGHTSAPSLLQLHLGRNGSNSFKPVSLVHWPLPDCFSSICSNRAEECYLVAIKALDLRVQACSNLVPPSGGGVGWGGLWGGLWVCMCVGGGASCCSWLPGDCFAQLHTATPPLFHLSSFLSDASF